MVIAALVAALSLSSAQDDAWTNLNARLKAAKSVQGKLELISSDQTQTADFKFMRPNFLFMAMPGNEVWIDERSAWMYETARKEYMKMPAKMMDIFFSMPFFVGTEAFWPKAKVPTSNGVREKEEAGVKYWTTSLVYPDTFMKDYTAELYIDQGTGLPVKFDMFKAGKKEGGGVYKELVLDGPLTAADFKFAPPAGSKMAETPAPQDYTKNLLKKGAKAPDFSLKTPAGGAVNLAAKLKTKKAVLINFWFYG
jgi:outer membrane lipoprotein-sorting protein